MDRDDRSAGRRALRKATEDPEAFDRGRRCLERAIASSCDPDRPWGERVATAVRAALEFAEAEPVSAYAVLVHSAFRRHGGSAEFEELVAGLAARFAEDAPPLPHPERTARNVVLRAMRQTLLQFELRTEPPTTIAPDLLVFALTPYLGLREAQRWAVTVS